MNDVRYGENPFPYGDAHDLGISLEKIVGGADYPGTTADIEYVAITLHKSYAEYAAANPGGEQERTIFVRASLFGTGGAISQLVTLRVSNSFAIEGSIQISGRLIGVIGAKGLIGLFSWRQANGAIEWFPDSAMRIFDAVLTAEDIDNSSWAGLDAYVNVTNGSPLYYFLWDNERWCLDGPVRRVLPIDLGAGDELPSNSQTFGVFVPVNSEGVPQSPIPAFTLWPGAQTLTCRAYVAELANQILSIPDDQAQVGSASIEESKAWGPPGGASTHENATAFTAEFEYYSEFPAADVDHTAGYFFNGWYNPALAIDNAAQNKNRVFLTSAAELSRVFLLDDHLDFQGGLLSSPNRLYLELEPAEGELADVGADLVFSLGTEALTANGSSSALFAVAYSDTANDGAVACYGSFYASMWITCYTIKSIGYRVLANGSTAGQFLTWVEGASTGEPGTWTPTGSPLPNGTVDGQVLTWHQDEGGGSWGAEEPDLGVPTGTHDGELLIWDATAGEWVLGPYGLAAGQVLKWNGTTWIVDYALAAGNNGDTFFYDDTIAVPGWTANQKLKWEKPAPAETTSTGGRLVMDLTGVTARAANAAMPGIVVLHPAGGTCGMFADIQSGAASGPRMDVGWAGTTGAAIELCAASHGTRPGHIAFDFGQTGQSEFRRWNGTSWQTVASIDKDGKFECQGTTGALTHTVKINPAGIAFATGNTASAQTLQIREMLIPYDDSGTVKAKYAQVLCSPLYGTAKTLGGAALPTGNAAWNVLGTDANNNVVWLATSLLEVV